MYHTALLAFVLLLSTFSVPGLARNNETTDKKLFIPVPTEKSGVEFISRLIPDHKFGYLYHSGMTCSGLAIGDLNGDDRPDLFLANGPGSNALYVQQGNGIHFKDVTANAGAELEGGERWASGVAMADVDNDGDLDIYVCNYESPNQLFINQGVDRDGNVQFEEMAKAAGIDIVDASHMASFCDYDADGDLDMFLLTNRVEDPNGTLTELPVTFERPGVPKLLPGYERSYTIWVVDADNWGVEPVGRSDYLFRNDGNDENGNAKFTDVTTQSGIAGRGDGLSCLWWDADMDGDSDLYVCNDFISADRFFINNGDGTFTNSVADALPHIAWFSMGSNFGDIDNDGDFDLFVADMSATSHYKSKVTMGIMGGMNLQRANMSTPPQYMRNSLFLNEGDLTFREGAYMAGLASSDWTWSVKLNDFDSDGMLDMYLTNGVPREMNHSDIVITQEMLAGKHMWEFFKDGKMRKEQNMCFQNLGSLKFNDVSAIWGLDHLGASYGAATADLDLDGDLDMVVMNLEENITIYENNGNDSSNLVVHLRGTTANRFGVGAKVIVESGDRKWIRQLMPAAGYHSYDEPLVHFGLGDAKEIDRVIVEWPGGKSQIVDDVKVNSRLVVSQNDQTPTLIKKSPKRMFVQSTALDNIWHRENQFNDFSLQPLLPHELSSEGPCMAWADVNSDGHADVFIGGSIGTSSSLRLSSDKGYVSVSRATFAKDILGEDASAKFADLDGDGDMDLLVGRGSYEIEDNSPMSSNILYLNDGSGEFTHASDGFIPESRFNTGCIATCDFDQDGDIDVFLGTRVKHAKYPLSEDSELWINDGNSLRVATGKTAELVQNLGMVTDALWSDVDNDGWQDLIVAREFDSIAIYRNNKGELAKFTGGDLQKRTGWWKSLAAGDIDNDGDMDLVATNVGLNTKYKTSFKKPMTLYFGKFDETGDEHIVEVKQEGDVCYPERGRSCSSNAMPFIADKFETFHEFGLASLSEIYGDAQLEQAKRFEANTFEHGLFENDGNGTFKFKPLPRISQIAPAGDCAISDLDRDGNLDVILGQNFLRPQSETSRYDGGLGQILMNSGNGKLTPASVSESGFKVRQAVTSLKVIDTNNDDRLDIVVATNDGPVILFQNQTTDQEN